METKFVIAVCLALSYCAQVNAEGEQEVKRGLFPFMAFLYYPDESVVDGSGARFLRGAVLIQPDWLVTSAVGPSILNNSPNGFPRKTLLARAGAITIDANFTLNEDEDEQEREIIQIVRPYNYSATQWWHTDIALMRTLQPFNMTTAVSVTMLLNRLNIEKTCTILVYAKKEGNWSADRNLIQLNVELLPPSVANCGHNFLEKSMICAANSDENKNVMYDSHFCQGNRGGPLICEGDVIGIQTYIDNDCKQPHLYQLLSAWDNFISCGTEDKCHEEQCSKICDVTNKDPYDLTIPETTTKKDETLKPTSPDEVATDTSIETTTESESQPHVTTVMSETELTTTQRATVYQVSSEHPTTQSITTQRRSKDFQTSLIEEDNVTTSWPPEKYPNARKEQEIDNSVRQPNVEAQQQKVETKKQRQDSTSSKADINVLSHSVVFAYLVLIRLI